MPREKVDPRERLAQMNEQRLRARAEFPELVRLLEVSKIDFPNGESHLCPRGAPIKKAVDMQQMAMANLWEMMGRAKESKRRLKG